MICASEEEIMKIKEAEARLPSKFEIFKKISQEYSVSSK